MEGIKLTPARIAKIKKDIERVKQHSIGFIKINKNSRFRLVANKEKVRLGLIGIIGPPEGFEDVFDEALLCEIGVGRTRPYTEARGLKRVINELNIPARGKYFSLSKQQYQLIAPLVFELIEEMAYERVSRWKKGPFSEDPFWLPSSWHFWSKRGKKFHNRASWAIAVKGSRFSIALKDIFFVKDVYWAELNLNENLKGKFLVKRGHINGLVNFIDKRLNDFRSERKYKGKKPFRELEGVKQVERILRESSLSRHLLIEVVRRLRDEKKNIFSEYIADMIGWDGLESEENKLVKSVLLEPESRLNDIQLRVTTGLDVQKDRVVFEVYPRPK